MNATKPYNIMGTVYKTKQDDIFSCDLYMEQEGKKYAIDTRDIVNIQAFPLSELTTLGDTFTFITRYYPDYGHSDAIASLDDLDCLIGNECDAEKLERLTYIHGSDPKAWEREREKLYADILDSAIDNYNDNRKN